MSTTASFHALNAASTLDEVIERSAQKPVLIFKHSATCPLSARMQQEITPLSTSGILPIYKLVVQESRSVSNKIEQMFGIRHESPQVILLYDHSPIFDASHGRISAEAIQKTITKVTA